MNNVVLVGRLTKDPELKYLPGTGTAVATFTVAIDRDYTKKDGTRDTDFIPVEVMGKSAEYCANYISKGNLVSVVGSIRVEKYKTQEGEKRTFTKVNTKLVKQLTLKNKVAGEDNGYEFEPEGLDPQGFQAIEDNDIPF
ncbi:TPA: single-stranded DNA-binding protein [Clostridioides difficile]